MPPTHTPSTLGRLPLGDGLFALLLLVAYALFAPALLGKTRRSSVDRQKINLRLHQQRREELAAEYSGKELEKLQAELDKDLLGDLTDAETQKDASDKGRLALLVALVAAPLLALFIYGQLGRYDLADFRAQPQQAPEKPVGAPELQEMIDRLAERLKKDGGDFDQFAGATITPRAVVHGVESGLKFYRQHKDELLQ